MLLLSVPLHTMAARRASTALRTAMLANGCRLGGRVGAATMLRGGGEKLHGYGAMPNASARRSRIRARRLRTRIVQTSSTRPEQLAMDQEDRMISNRTAKQPAGKS